MTLIDRVAAANPVRLEDLGDTAVTPRAEALLREIVARRERRKRRPVWMVVVLPAAAVVAVTAVVFAVLRPEPLPGQTLVSGGEAYGVMAAAAGRARTAQGTGRYWHSQGEVRVLIPRKHKGNEYTLVAASPIDSWQPTDKRDGDGVVNNDAPKVWPLTEQDATAYRKDGSPQPNENPDPDMGVVVPDPPDGPEIAGDSIYEGDPMSLPLDARGMRVAMLAWVRDHGGLPRNPEAWLFREGVKILDSTVAPLPPERRGAVFRMLATLPGVRSLGQVKDPLGRRAVAVALGDETKKHGTLEWRLYLSPVRDMIMGLEAVVTETGPATRHLKPGQALYSRVVRKAEWTNGCPPGRLPSMTRSCP